MRDATQLNLMWRWDVNGYTHQQLVRVRSILIEVASTRDTITYSDLAKKAHLRWNHKRSNDRRLMGLILGDISKEEYRRGRPLLTAIVVRKDTLMPGEGFRGLVGFPETDEFWEVELRRVHDFWEWPDDEDDEEEDDDEDDE